MVLKMVGDPKEFVDIGKRFTRKRGEDKGWII